MEFGESGQKVPSLKQNQVNLGNIEETRTIAITVALNTGRHPIRMISDPIQDPRLQALLMRIEG